MASRMIDMRSMNRENYELKTKKLPPKWEFKKYGRLV